MRDENKSKKQLIKELVELRQRVVELETTEAERKQAEEALRESEAKYRSLIDSIGDMIFSADRAGVFKTAGGGRLRKFGLTPEDVIGHSLEELFGEEASQYQERHWQVFKSGEALTYEQTVKFAGVTKTDLTTIYPIKNEHGEVELVGGICRDITERKQAEEALRESEEKYRQLFTSESDAIMIFDADTRQFVDINDAALRLYGYTREEFLKLRHLDITAEVEESDDSIQQTLAGKLSKIPIRYHKKKDGSVFPVEIAASSFTLKNRKVLCGVIRDITERKETEEALRKNEAMLRSIFDSSPNAITVTDLNGTILECNQMTLEIHGCSSKDEILGKNAAEFIAEEDHGRAAENMRKTLEQGFIKNVEYTLVTKGGQPFPGELSASVMTDSSGNPTGFVAVTGDITERKRAEEALRKSEAKFRYIFDSGMIGIIYWNLEGNITDANEAFLNMVGYTKEELLTGKASWKNMTPPEYSDLEAKAIEEIVQRGIITPYEKEYIRKDGRRIPIILGAAKLEEYGGTGVGFVLDITDHKRAEEALRASEERYRALVSNIPGAVFRCDENWMIHFISDAIQEITGYPPSDFVGDKVRGYASIMHPEDVKMVEEIASDCLGRKIPIEVEYRVVCVDGSLRWVHDRSQGVFNERGELVWIDGVVLDITERKRAEEELRKFKIISDRAGHGIATTDLEGNLLYLNESFAKMHGYTPEELIGRNLSIFHNEEQMEDVDRLKKQLREEASYIAEEVWHIRKDGTVFPTLMNGTLIRDEKGKPLFMAATAIDSSERMRAEKVLKESEERYRLLLESISDSVYVLDREWRHVVVNNAAERFVQIPKENLLGSKLTELFPGVEETEFFKVFERVMETWKSDIVTNEYTFEDGREGWYEVHVYPVPEGILCISRDITERRRAEEELEQYRHHLETLVEERTAELNRVNAELVRANRLKDEFLANMSHELRTPLNVILGMSESLQEEVYGPLNDRQRKSLHLIEESGHHLLTLIIDILDLSKIGVGKLELEITPVLVESTCQAALRLTKQLAYKKRLKVSSMFDSHVTTIHADGRRLKQILVNLLNNAVKFTPEGGKVGLEVEGDSEQQVVHFTVWDTGIGIAPEDMERLFQPFVQLDASLSRKYEGTGLGLALVSRIVDLHGGSVSVESEVGQGSRFTVSLPWQELGAGEIGSLGDGESQDIDPHSPIFPSPHLPISSPPQSRTILIAEDNEATITTLSGYFVAKGDRVLIARNGWEAVVQTREFHPDIVVMDIQMPEMDGLGAIHHIRSDQHGESIPIIALTALAMPGDQEQCLAAGADEYLSKPVSLRRLSEAIERFLSRKE